MATRFEELKDMGNKAVQAKKYENALKHYQDAFKLDSSSQVLHANMSLCYRQTKNYELSEFHALEAVRLAPTWARGHQRLAELAESIGLHGRAVAIYGRAISVASEQGETKQAAELGTHQQKAQAAHEKEVTDLLVSAQNRQVNLSDTSTTVRVLYLRAKRLTATEEASRASLLRRLRSVDAEHERELVRGEPKDLTVLANASDLRQVLEGKLQVEGQAYMRDASTCALIPASLQADVLAHPALLHALLTTAKVKVPA